MQIDVSEIINILLALFVALVISCAVTPIVKQFATKIGAIDVPGEARRTHDHPIPRMGGLAIFLGFILSVVLFVKIDTQIRGILLGSVVIVVTGAIDDIISLKAWVKFIVQVAAAGIAVLHGLRIEVFTNPVQVGAGYFNLGAFSVPVTILWLVAITNSVNLIDGLDGLACGISAISGVMMLIISLLVAQSNVAALLAALAGACIGFMPYNMNPAKIFMGDTGALLLGYVLATVSVVGMFKTYALISFLIPFLVLAVPFFDTAFAFIRRILKGQNPMKADRGHFHHRLIDMGLNQKQAVAILYCVSAILGLTAVIIASSGRLKVLIFVIAVLAAVAIAVFAQKAVNGKNKKDNNHKE